MSAFDIPTADGLAPVGESRRICSAFAGPQKGKKRATRLETVGIFRAKREESGAFSGMCVASDVNAGGKSDRSAD